MTADDAELTAILLARRDQAAFGELVRRHQAFLRNMLARMTGDRSWADDLAQETFVHAFERLDQFGGHGSFKSWICQVAYSRFLQAARKRKSERRLLSALAEAGAVAPSSVAAASGDAVDLDRALRALKDEERACIVLCYACGFSHAEASEVLKIPLGTVKSHVQRGRQKLETLLTNAGKADDE